MTNNHALRRQVGADLLLLLVTLVWGGTFVMVKGATADYPIFPFLTLRFALATGALLLVGARRLGRLGWRGWGRGALPPLQLTKLRVCYNPVWSPDGGRIAFVSEQDRTDDIWVMNPDGSDPRNLTENDWEWDKHPSWSPDGSKIVFWSNREGRKQLFVMDADGRNVRNISNTPDDEYDPVWIR